MAGVRSRNESAWLLPNDGTRTNHQQRLDMRQFADEDEIDLVIVGCGAGGSVLLQRLARAGGRGAGPGAGPLLGPGAGWGAGGSGPGARARSGTRTRTGSVTRPARTGCTGPPRG